MRRRVVFGILAVCILGVRATSAEPSTTPLYSAFKSFCADTGARADDVKAAVLAAGGAPHDPPTRSVGTPFSMQTMLWDVKTGGQALVVAAGRARTTGADARAMVDCVVSGKEMNAASLAALARWADVATSGEANARIAYYVFEDKDGSHRAISDPKAAEEEGRIWRLTVIHTPGVASVELMHLLGRGQ